MEAARSAVICHQHDVDAQRVYSDQNSIALALGGGPGGSVDLNRARVPGQDVYSPEEVVNHGVERSGVGPPAQTEQQFTLGDGSESQKMINTPIARRAVVRAACTLNGG